MRDSWRALSLSLTLAVTGLACALVPQQAARAQDDGGFRAYLESLRPKARGMGISDATLNAVYPTLTPNPRVVELDRSQPGGGAYSPIPNFEP